jgi:hypothetical protein
VTRDITDRKRAEEERDRFFNLSMDMLSVSGTDAYFKRLNPAFEQVLGYTNEELLAQPFLDFVHPDDRAATLAEVEKLAEGHLTLDFENRYRCKDGSYRWFSWKAFPIVEENLIYSIARDVTERKQAEAERLQLLAQEQQARAEAEAARNQSVNILESITDAFFALDRDWRYTYLNRQAELVLQRKREELLGQVMWDEFPEAVGSTFDLEYHRAVSEQVSVEFESFYPPLNVWFEVHAYPAREGLSVYFRDISDRKRTEAALRESEERFHQAFENAAIGMALVSLDGYWLQVNRSLCEMLGYSEQELLATSFQAVTHPDDLHIGLNYFQQLLSGETPSCQFEKRYSHKLGHTVWGMLSSSMVRDGQDQPLYIVTQIEDITDRKQAHEELRNLSKALESAVEGIAQLDPQGRYIKTNPAYASMLGYQPEELLGMNWKQTIYPEELETTEIAYQRMLIDGKAEFEARALRNDGTIFDKQVVMVKAYDQHQQFIGNYCFMKDISDRREIERLKDEFISVVSHELRTPLTSISAALDLLAGGVLQNQPEDAQQMLNIAANNSDRLVRLINDILDIERIESGKVVMTKQACDAGDLMNQSVEAIQEIAEKAGVTLSVSPVSVRLWADPDRIIQVFTNLLSNAIKFSPQGSTVWLSAELIRGQGSGVRGQESGVRAQGSESVYPSSSPDTLLIKVRDQGRGIPSDKIESIFERFQQVDASDSRQKGGTGLGLAICRSILQQHEGQIWAQSTLGEGSTFYFTLPILSDVQRPEFVPPDGGPASLTILSAELGDSTQNSPLVLVCDDDSSVRTVVRAMLERQGYRVLSVASGREAVEQSVAQPPDVILLNLMMPEMDGWETLAVLKNQIETQMIPVIILSGLLPDARETPHPGVSDWIVKPPEPRILRQALERVLADRNQTIKVLIVEDNLELAQVLATMFSRHGIETFHAQTGRDAIHLSQRILPDLLVLDLALPEYNGFAVVDWLRQHNRLRQVPLVVYTAQDLDESDRERLKLGQTLFFTKGRITSHEFEQRAIDLLNRMIRGKTGDTPDDH